MLTAIHTNIKKLRAQFSLSQKEVAHKAGISVAAYRKLEQGETREPRVSTLSRIAEVFDVSMETLMKPPAQTVGIRFRSQARVNSKQQIVEGVLKWLQDRKELEGKLEIVSESPLKDYEKRLLLPQGEKTEELKNIAEEVREKIFDIEKTEPIRDIYNLLESKGIKVHSFYLMNDDVFGVSVSGGELGPAIAINCWERIPVERWIFTAAHELGHLVLHPDTFVPNDGEDYDLEEEEEANIFASYFLMPDELFDSEWESSKGIISFVDRVFYMKRLFRVSYKTILYRLYRKYPGTEQLNVWKKFYRDHRERYGKSLRKEDEAGEPLKPEVFGKPEGEIFGEPENKASLETQREHLLPEGFVDRKLLSLALEALEKKKISESRAREILQWEENKFQKILNDYREQKQLGMSSITDSPD